MSNNRIKPNEKRILHTADAITLLRCVNQLISLPFQNAAYTLKLLLTDLINGNWVNWIDTKNKWKTLFVLDLMKMGKKLESFD